MKQLQVLYRLQTLETSLDEAKARLVLIESALANNTELQAARSELEAKAQALHTAHGALQDLELEQVGLAEKLYQNEETLYSGRITNPKELREREQEIEALKRRQEKLRGDVASAKEAHQQATESHQSAQITLEETERRVEDENHDLLKEQETLRRNMATWLKDRKAVLETLLPENHKLYKQLKTAKNGLAVARLSNRVCQGCQIEQNQSIVDSVRRGEITTCLACARILVEL